MKKIFITGICGFVGSSLASYFLKKNYQVFGVDNFSRKGSYKNYLRLKGKKVKIFKANLCRDNIFNIIPKKKIRYFIHCAAYTSVLDGTNKIDAKHLYENNLLSTLNSLELANRFDSNFIYISSSRIYSIELLNNLKLKFKKIYKPLKNNLNSLSSMGVKENFQTTPPLSLYGSSKIACETIVQEYCKLKKIPYVINRCGLIAGSGQLYKNDQGIISFWINSWKKNKKLYYIGFNGKGYQTRDCLHPYDLATLINLQFNKIRKLKECNKIFNVSGGLLSAFSLKELSQWCADNIFIKKIKSNKKNRKYDVKWLVLDNSKVKKEFKWKIRYNKYQIFKDILNEND